MKSSAFNFRQRLPETGSFIFKNEKFGGAPTQVEFAIFL